MNNISSADLISRCPHRRAHTQTDGRVERGQGSGQFNGRKLGPVRRLGLGLGPGPSWCRSASAHSLCLLEQIAARRQIGQRNGRTSGKVKSIRRASCRARRRRCCCATCKLIVSAGARAPLVGGHRQLARTNKWTRRTSGQVRGAPTNEGRLVLVSFEWPNWL